MGVRAILAEGKIRAIATEEAIIQSERLQNQIHQLNQRIIDIEKIMQVICKNKKEEKRDGSKRRNRLGNNK